MDASQIAQVAAGAGFSGDALNIAVAVALAESSGDPSAVSPTGDYGLWQINLASHPDVPRSCALDPACCAGAAYRISSGGTDWQPWATYTSGRYRQFLNQAQAAAAPASQGGASMAPLLPSGANRIVVGGLALLALLWLMD